MAYLEYIIAGLSVAGALLTVLISGFRTRRTMDRLSRMVDEAMDGSFEERDYNENMMSALESKWAGYLRASALSAGALAEEKEAIKSLIADISHQTKTSIANVLLYCQLLKECELDGQGRECAQALEAQAEKLKQLTDALVKLSRLESGVLQLHPEPGQLEDLAAAAAAQAAPAALGKNQLIVLEPGRAACRFDRKWTEEAVFNLLDNAVKYCPCGSEIHISVMEYQFFARITVRDTGPGIAEDEQAQVFSRFYRGRGRHDTEGVGIGLYLVRQIAQGQGGYVRLDSLPGQGAEFSIYLPRE